MNLIKNIRDAEKLKEGDSFRAWFPLGDCFFKEMIFVGIENRGLDGKRIIGIFPIGYDMKGVWESAYGIDEEGNLDNRCSLRSYSPYGNPFNKRGKNRFEIFNKYNKILEKLK